MADLETVHATIDHTGITGVGGSTPAFVGARVYKAAVQSIPTGSTPTALTFDTEEFDTNSLHDTVTNPTRLTIPVGKSGKWRIDASSFCGAAGIGYWTMRLKVNGTDARGCYRASAITSANEGGPNISTVLSLSAGDYVEVFVSHGSGSSVNFGGASALTQSVFEAQFLG